MGATRRRRRHPAAAAAAARGPPPEPNPCVASCIADVTAGGYRRGRRCLRGGRRGSTPPPAACTLHSRTPADACSSASQLCIAAGIRASAAVHDSPAAVAGTTSTQPRCPRSGSAPPERGAVRSARVRRRTGGGSPLAAASGVGTGVREGRGLLGERLRSVRCGCGRPGCCSCCLACCCQPGSGGTAVEPCEVPLACVRASSVACAELLRAVAGAHRRSMSGNDASGAGGSCRAAARTSRGTPALVRARTVLQACMYVCTIDKKSLDFARLASPGQRRYTL